MLRTYEVLITHLPATTIYLNKSLMTDHTCAPTSKLPSIYIYAPWSRFYRGKKRNISLQFTTNTMIQDDSEVVSIYRYIIRYSDCISLYPCISVSFCISLSLLFLCLQPKLLLTEIYSLPLSLPLSLTFFLFQFGCLLVIVLIKFLSIFTVAGKQKVD